MDNNIDNIPADRLKDNNNPTFYDYKDIYYILTNPDYIQTDMMNKDMTNKEEEVLVERGY